MGVSVLKCGDGNGESFINEYIPHLKWSSKSSLHSHTIVVGLIMFMLCTLIVCRCWRPASLI